MRLVCFGESAHDDESGALHSFASQLAFHYGDAMHKQVPEAPRSVDPKWLIAMVVLVVGLVGLVLFITGWRKGEQVRQAHPHYRSNAPIEVVPINMQSDER